MNSPELERFLATLYVNSEARAKFLAAPRQEAARAGLSEDQCRALENIDRIGLEMAARSFARKRAVKAGRGRVVSQFVSRFVSRVVSHLVSRKAKLT